MSATADTVNTTSKKTPAGTGDLTNYISGLKKVAAANRGKPKADKNISLDDTVLATDSKVKGNMNIVENTQQLNTRSNSNSRIIIT